MFIRYINKFVFQIRRIHTNVIVIGILGFLTNFSASIVHTTAVLFIGDTIISSNLLILIRNFSEAFANFYKIFGGIISDYCKKRKLFLVIGYVGVVFCKTMVTVVTLKKYIPISIIVYIYVINQFIDRCINAIRDPARDAIILETVKNTDPEFVNISFGIRKFITSLGSVFGGIFTFLLLWIIEYKFSIQFIYFVLFIPIFIMSIFIGKYLKKMYINIFVFFYLFLIKYLSKYLELSTIIYSTAIVPVVLATLLVVKKIQEVKKYTNNSSSDLSFKYIFKNYKEFKNIFIIINILIFSSFGRICDLGIFKRGLELGISSYKIPLMFVVLYISVALFSYFLSCIKDDQNYVFKTIFFCLSSLLLGNIILYKYTNFITFWIGLILISGYLSLTDGVMSSIISRYIPNEGLTATVFGLTYGFTGLFLMLNGVFTFILRKYIFTSFQNIHGVMCVPILIAILILIYFRKELV
ncbi:hypothetical protein AB836_00470 [Rickettsiales bacterium (ex Bugula neritina AB1)]|nr:hypothetical protein AB836_00470 [Rickettsiales bacterium (ex Bugula neritina AB1)]